VTLARQDESSCDFRFVECEVCVHAYFAFEHLRTTGATHTGFTGVWHVYSGGERAFEHGFAFVRNVQHALDSIGDH
jgi:hypothetical protein